MLLRLWAYFGNEDLWFELLLRGRSVGPQWFQELTRDVLSFTEAVRVLVRLRAGRGRHVVK